MLNDATRQFVLAHREDDVRQLALRSSGQSGVDMPMALQQIAGWQAAKRKLPSWAAVEGIVFPPHLNMEQCSSELTARYKQSVVLAMGGKGSVYVDLTGGFGVDFVAMSQPFSERIYVEQSEALCAMARHNFPLMGVKSHVVCADAVAFLHQMECADVVFLDPARRDSKGGRTYGIEDCTPNVIDLLPQLRAKAQAIVLKLSPMLDWRKAVGDVGGASAVHIVSVDNECKELLIVLSGEDMMSPPVICVNLLSDGRQERFEINALAHHDTCPAFGDPMPNAFLYEPNASIMKAGCWQAVEARWGARQIGSNTHLLVSTETLAEFPGRGFRIESVSSLNKRELKMVLSGIDSANIAVRNFPLSAAELRQKLRLRDGGSCYIFGVTLANGQHKLLICRKIG